MELFCWDSIEAHSPPLVGSAKVQRMFGNFVPPFQTFDTLWGLEHCPPDVHTVRAESVAPVSNAATIGQVGGRIPPIINGR